MSGLVVKPLADAGKIHALTPPDIRDNYRAPNWRYVGFSLYKLAIGDKASENTDDREVILVLIEGKANITVDGQELGEIGQRLDVFDRLPPACVYVPGGSEWQSQATTNCTIAVCAAPAVGNYEARILGPEGIKIVTRGKGANTRYIHNIAMEERDVAGSLLVTEVYTPAGHWSSYPPHRHDEDNFPDITYLEEIYYHRLNPAQGYGYQRVFTEDGSLDENIAVVDQDVVLVPKGHHPCAAPYGYDMYYLNVMAGPLRKWRFKNHPDHSWIYERDK